MKPITKLGSPLRNKGIFLLASAAFVASACSSAAGTGGSGPGSSSAPKQPQTGQSDQTGAASSTADVSQAATQKKGYNPSRLYQLYDLKVVNVKANGHTIHAWVMDTEGKQAEGMMFLTKKDVKDNQGMLFVFSSIQPNDGNHSFWMENCPLALDIIYISANKRVINIQPGIPFNKTEVPPYGPYKWVVEVKQGIAKRLGIHAGTRFTIPNVK